MSRTIASRATKVADKMATEEIDRRREGITGGYYKGQRKGPSTAANTVWHPAYKAQFSGRRRRRLYAAARKAKANIELPGRPSHDDAGDVAGFTCLYG